VASFSECKREVDRRGRYQWRSIGENKAFECQKNLRNSSSLVTEIVCDLDGSKNNRRTGTTAFVHPRFSHLFREDLTTKFYIAITQEQYRYVRSLCHFTYILTCLFERLY